MYRALLLSIPGSGTRFTRDFLENCLGYYSVSPKKIADHPVNSPVYAFHHIDDPVGNITSKIRHLKTVIPVRPPVSTFKTRFRQYGDEEKCLMTILDYWQTLNEKICSYDHVLLPVEENLDRVRVLNIVVDHLEAREKVRTRKFYEIAVHWKKVGSYLTPLEDPQRWYQQMLSRYKSDNYYDGTR